MPSWEYVKLGMGIALGKLIVGCAAVICILAGAFVWAVCSAAFDKE